MRLLAEVARLYYIEDLNQEQIAQRVGGSRSNVSRMLREARSRGLVEIRIRTPLTTVAHLQEELKTRMGLRGCLVLATEDQDLGTSEAVNTAVNMAALTARYIQENIADHSILGVGWSRTIYRSVNSGYFRKKRGVEVVQLLGSVGGNIPELDGISTAGRLAGALGATAHYLHAPVLVIDSTVRNGLLRDQNIRTTLEIARRADAMVVAVGPINRHHGQYVTGYLNDADLDYIRGNGAVGDVCGSYFSRDGSLIPLEMNERTVAVGFEDMRRIPHRIGVSWGVDRPLANVGAVRAGLLNVLITDEDAARRMVEILDSESPAVSSTDNEARSAKS
ncbi:MAG: deoxyribonucleoside regulator [Rubrobacteraceae bacterium]|jgi:DNA-binding transcriptional regulator LsrR (DeoR family)|nr:deoxyribonucleoside regulator [Rubrobacteraceae bacterium]